MGYTVYLNSIVNTVEYCTALNKFSGNEYNTLWSTLCEDYCFYMGRQYSIKSVVEKLESLLQDMSKESIITTLRDGYINCPNSHIVFLFIELSQYDENNYISFS